ncbi:MAG TPA: RDD family protein [Gammaproteobacteria bacterium]
MNQDRTRTTAGLIPADLHNRFGAFAIDWHIRTSPLALWGFWVFFAWFPEYWRAAVDSAPSLAVAWRELQPVLDLPGVAATGWLTVALYLLYHPLLELAMHGDSPGKRMMGIRVVSLDDSRPTARQVLVRNLWRAIEFLPIAWLWGYIAIRRSPENARTGDIMAGTRVVMRSA